MKKKLEVFFRYRYLLYNLISRDIKIKYRRSTLGIIWSILNPLLMMLVITAVFSNLFKLGIENFPVYYLTGSVLFNFFSEATSLSITSIIDSSTLIKKVYIPKYIFPMEKVLFGFVNLLFSLIAVIIIFFITKTHVTATILLFPIPLVYMLVFTMGVSLFLSAMAVYFRDILHLFSVILIGWMYFTPIIYPMEILPPSVAFVMNFNPLYHYVKYFRDIAMYNTVPDLMSNLICIGFALLSMIVGLLVFKKKQKDFILYV